MPNRPPSALVSSTLAHLETRSGERRAWADEVAIDFPSVAAIATRVRQAFLAQDEAPRPVRADVWLTGEEAACGLELSVSARWRGACSACAGRGEDWRNPCRHCGGTGESTTVRVLTVTIPPHAADGDTFRIPIEPAGASPSGDRPFIVEIRVRRQLPVGETETASGRQGSRLD